MPGAFPIIQKAFETIGFAKVATSAQKAKSYGYLREKDKIIMNRDHLLFHAIKEVLSLSDNSLILSANISLLFIDIFLYQFVTI